MVFDEDVDVENEVDFTDDHLKSLKEIGKTCLFNFFQGKQMHYGGSVSRAMLGSPRVLTRILTTDIIGGVDRAYLSLSLGRFGREKSKNGLRKDMQLILDILNECSELRIPKCFRGGILLLYIEFCHGIEIA